LRAWYRILLIDGDRVKVAPLAHKEALTQCESFLTAINERVLAKVCEAFQRRIHDLELDCLGGYVFDVTAYGPSLTEKAEKLSQDLEKSKRPVFHTLMASEEEEEDRPPRLSNPEIERCLDKAVDFAIFQNQHVRRRF